MRLLRPAQLRGQRCNGFRLRGRARQGKYPVEYFSFQCRQPVRSAHPRALQFDNEVQPHFAVFDQNHPVGYRNGFFFGNSACTWSRAAMQSACQGHAPQRGERGVQTSAPSSISDWVKSPYRSV